MAKPRRPGTTIYLNPEVAKSAKVRAALTDLTLSEFVSDAVVRALSEDEEDLRAIRERSKEPERDFEVMLRDLRKRGLL